MCGHTPRGLGKSGAVEQCPSEAQADAQQCSLHEVARRCRFSIFCTGRRAIHQRRSPTCRTRRNNTSSREMVCSSCLFHALVILRSCSVVVTPYPRPLHTRRRLRAAVPCHQRAAAVTGAAAAHEKLVEGDEGEQWVEALGPDGSAKQRAAAAAGPDDDIPTLGDDDAAAQKVGPPALESGCKLHHAARCSTPQQSRGVRRCIHCRAGW